MSALIVMRIPTARRLSITNISDLVTATLPNPQIRRWSGAAVAAPHLETVYKYVCTRKTGSSFLNLVAECLTLSVLAIEVTQPAGAPARAGAHTGTMVLEHARGLVRPRLLNAQDGGVVIEWAILFQQS
jgi:hypothetical protein